jgi:hypothetical protein
MYHLNISFRWFEALMMLFIVLHGCTLLAVGWGTNPFPTPPSKWTPTWDQVVLLVIFSFYT